MPFVHHPYAGWLRYLGLWSLTVLALYVVLPGRDNERSVGMSTADSVATNNHRSPHPVASQVDLVSARDEFIATPDERTLAGPPKLETGSQLVALLPDTQYYSWRYPEVFHRQTRWIAQSAQTLDIKLVLHLGDIVNNNTAPQWRAAASALSRLSGVVPYVVVPGNHDYGPNGSARTRRTGLNSALAFDEHAEGPTFGGAYETGRLDNTFHLFSAGGHEFILLALEWGPRDAVIEWANEVMRAHPYRKGILVTHAYLYRDSRRYDHSRPELEQRNNPHDYATEGGVNDGEELWQKLVRHHRFVMTFNGHVTGTGTGYLASVTDRGTTCHQMLSNYQMRDRGGEGYLRLIELHSDRRTVTVHSYSPWLDERLVNPSQHFQFVLGEAVGG